ncbi:Kinesin-like protein C [Giardia duodenalis assemblage B]|uniref:Kinesin-like protein C n=1 Tax=Giardia duodenalis assemblage B TaxID=1394984 RepID=A0A132NRX6_GIAIN|nr:Kinesin-like protein C [Giardia intestinalis assemblage B]
MLPFDLVPLLPVIASDICCALMLCKANNSQISSRINGKASFSTSVDSLFSYEGRSRMEPFPHEALHVIP